MAFGEAIKMLTSEILLCYLLKSGKKITSPGIYRFYLPKHLVVAKQVYFHFVNGKRQKEKDTRGSK